MHYLHAVSRTYPIYQAKAKLSEIIRQVKRGRTVVISERGHDVARVVPVGDKEDLDSRIKRMLGNGLIIPASRPVAEIRPVARRRGALKRFLESRD
jgi:prevent-host-death family protein